MTDEEVAFLLSTTRPGTTLVKQLKVDLQLRMGKRQSKSADALVVATERLVQTTGRLGWATWALVVVTVLRAIAAGVQTIAMLRSHP